MSDFQSTVWTLIRDAGAGRSTAIHDFVLRYRPAVVAFARRRGLGEADAEDLAQEVFLRLFDQRVLARTDPARGRFRNLLLAVTRHVLGHARERGQARKRGGGRSALSLDESGVLPIAELAAATEPDADFDREWVACLLALAFRRLAAEHAEHHAVVQAFLLRERSHREIAAELGLTEAAVRHGVSRGRARLAAILREEIQAYSASPRDFEAELACLAPYLTAGR